MAASHVSENALYSLTGLDFLYLYLIQQQFFISDGVLICVYLNSTLRHNGCQFINMLVLYLV